MTETPRAAPASTTRRRAALVVLALSILALAGILGLFAAASNEALVLACVDDDGLLPPSLACAYLEHVRDPDPNQPESQGHPQTLFGFTLAGYDPTNPRSVALLDDFMARGVQWSAPHDRALTPLHLAVLAGDEGLVERFLAAGASTSARIVAPQMPLHDMSALDFARLLRRKAGEQASGDSALARIERRLVPVGGEEPD